MKLTKLGTTGLRMAINGVTFTEAETTLMRDGRDVETEMSRRGKALTEDTITITRYPLEGFLEVKATHNSKLAR